MFRLVSFRIDPTNGAKLVDRICEASTRKKCTDWANKRGIRVKDNPLVELKEIVEDQNG